MSSPTVAIVIDFRKSTEGTMVMREKKTSRFETTASRKRIWPTFSPEILGSGTKRARSQRQVSGDIEIRNGCKRIYTTGARIERGRMPLFASSIERDPRGAERTRFSRSTLTNVDHRCKGSLNTPLMSRLHSLVACGYAISPSLTLPLCVRRD